MNTPTLPSQPTEHVEPADPTWPWLMAALGAFVVLFLGGIVLSFALPCERSAPVSPKKDAIRTRKSWRTIGVDATQFAPCNDRADEIA